jgi:rhamnopyranosyl-N-acetylglucosaminyl-diphospho-decaprenol beta-1,3/1,4-galactofuranosyltransferase
VSERVGALVVTYNRKDLLRECLTAVRNQSRAVDHIVVVDGASTDGTPEMLAEEFPEVELVRLAQNEGASGGFHEALRVGLERDMDWLWTMDDDTIPSPDALEQLLAGLARRDGLPEPVLLYSKVLWQDGRLHPMNQPCFDMRDPQRFLDGLERRLLPLRWATFPSMLLRPDAVRRNGLPNKRFFLWSDDIDFTGRILRHEPGYFVAESTAVHKTPTAHNPWEGGERFYYGVRNGIWTIRGEALEPKERVGHVLLVAEQSRRFLVHEQFRPRAIRTVLRGLRDGLLKRPA